jgi:hypothetical protein
VRKFAWLDWRFLIRIMDLIKRIKMEIFSQLRFVSLDHLGMDSS